MNTCGTYEYFAQERIIFGKPVEDALAEDLPRHGSAERVFIVSTRTLSRKTDVVERVKAALGGRFAGLYDDCKSHVPRSRVIEAAAAARAADPDLIIGIGGGSAIDTAKMVLVALGAGISASSDLDPLHVKLDDDGRSTIPEIKTTGIRQISIPTTLSGAEFSHTAGAVDELRHVKDLYIHRDLAAPTVILDPAITVHTPEWVWLSSGMRAVDHAVESICSRAAHPFTDSTCKEGLRMLKRSLIAVKTRPDDLGPRLDGQLGVWLSSSGMMRGQYGASHGLSFHLSAIADVPHGHCSCVLLPAVLRYNKPYNGAQQAVVSEMLDAPEQDAADVLLELIASLDLPTRLRDVGIRRQHFNKIANDAMRNILVRNNPRPVTSPEHVLDILEICW